jgi:hypothetical protein
MPVEAEVTVVIGRDEHGVFVHTHTAEGELHARPERTHPADVLHDLLHQMLAIYSGMQWSGVIANQMTKREPDNTMLALEEAAVLAIQQYFSYVVVDSGD